MLKKSSAFTFIELSIVILVIATIIGGLTQSSRVVTHMKLASARAQTQSAPITSIANLTLWLESTIEDNIVSSTHSTSPEDGDKISDWNNANPQLVAKTNLTQSTDASRPSYKTNIINNLPAMQFDGSNDYFTVANAISKDFSFFAVIKTAVAGNSGQGYSAKPVATSEVGGTTDDSIALAVGGGFAKIFTGNPDSTLTGSITISDDRPHVVCTTRDATSGARTIFVDGVADGSDTGRTGTLSANANTTFGADLVNGNYYSGYIAEIIIFERALKTEERQAIEKYLGKKWGVRI